MTEEMGVEERWMKGERIGEEWRGEERGGEEEDRRGGKKRGTWQYIEISLTSCYEISE